MDLIQIKIQKSPAMASQIKLIRAFDPSLPIGEIRRRIEAGDFVVEFDLQYYDMVEELEGVDRRAVFRQMISALLESGAACSIYQNGRPISLAFLDNWLETMDETARQVDAEIEKEAEDAG